MVSKQQDGVHLAQHTIGFNISKFYREPIVMLFYSFFKSLVGKDVVVELKNDLSICGTLHSVDQYLNIKVSTVALFIKES